MTPTTEGRPHRAGALIAWVVASSCLFFQFVVQVQPSAMIDELETSFQADAVDLGLLTSAYFLTYILLQIPMGWLLDHLGPRLVLGLSMFLGAAGMIWFGQASTLGSATAARILLGIAGAPAFAGAALVASRRFPESRFALMLGLTEAFTLLGGIAVAIGLPSLSLMVDRQGSGIVLAVVSVLLGVACFLLVDGREERSTGPSVSEETADPPRSVLRTLSDIRLWLAGLHAGLFFGIISAFAGLWAPPFFHARLGLEPRYASYPVAMLFAAGVLGAPLLGLICGLPRWRGPTLIVASFICAAASAALIYAPGGLVFLLIMIALLGFFSGVFGVDMACVQDAASPRRRGLAMGAANMMLGVVGGPLMLLVIARALDASSGSGEVAPMHATLPQMREALAWFVGAIALTIPIGVGLVIALKSGARTRGPMS